MTVDDKIRDEKVQYNINREAAKITALSSGKFDKYEFLTGEEILPSDQSRMIEQVKFTYSLLEKAFEKQKKTMEEQGIKQIDAITNQNERLAALSNKDDHKVNYKEIFEKLVKERLDEIKELTNKINQNGLTCCFKGDTAGKKFDGLNNGIELLKKI